MITFHISRTSKIESVGEMFNKPDMSCGLYEPANLLMISMNKGVLVFKGRVVESPIHRSSSPGEVISLVEECPVTYIFGGGAWKRYEAQVVVAQKSSVASHFNPAEAVRCSTAEELDAYLQSEGA